ncbi:MAG: zinc-binding metallopeptidase family protein [Acidimicrobiia bacterium]
MRAFCCPRCRQLVPFEAVTCLNCGTALGFAPDAGEIVAADGRARCANQFLASCNWLLAPGEAAGGLCLSCRLTRTRPHDADLAAGSILAEAFREAEAAKRRLVFQFIELGLPVLPRDGERALAFDLLSSAAGPVVTGHADGVITIDLAEGDDAHREQMRRELGEPYRTMLGHLRHESGHYFWTVLVEPDPAATEQFRRLFGDERSGYRAALARHYEQGPPAEWVSCYVSAYATAHPWEDWAETFAHYLHIRDTLQTAASFGMLVTGPPCAPDLIAAPSPEREDRFEDILDDWLPLTYALNAVNRSMGKGDLYPFVLSSVVIDKLTFVHQVVGSVRCRRPPGP